MIKSVDELKSMLYRCRMIISNGYSSNPSTGLQWLNGFCAEFLQFSARLHTFLAKEFDGSLELECREQMDTCFLCLTQVVTCIKFMEQAIKAEITQRVPLNATRQHFIERIQYCLERLCFTLNEILAIPNSCESRLDENNYLLLMDVALDNLTSYCVYGDDGIIPDVSAENAEALFAGKQIRYMVDLMIGHSLSLANVALKQDKNALSALSQKVLRECIAFQDECVLDDWQNDSNRRLRAISLENALYQLEDYLNEALLRIIFNCFNDFRKFSIGNMRSKIRGSNYADDPAVDELIADFDVNVDRIMQVGLFAIAFASNTKTKNIVSSCLASLESLDSYIIPSLYMKNPADLHSEILEQHFEEEVNAFRNAMQEIVDSHALTSCYYEMIVQCIARAEKSYDKVELKEILDMGELLCQHFELKCNQAELVNHPKRVLWHNKYIQIFRECQAIIICADQVDKSRVMKRFKIMRSMLRKFVDTLREKKPRSKKSHGDDMPTVFLLSDEISDSQRLFESAGIVPTRCSILYGQSSINRRRRKSNSYRDSLQATFSQLQMGTIDQLMKPSSVSEPLRQIAVPQVSAAANRVKHGKTSCEVKDAADGVARNSVSRQAFSAPYTPTYVFSSAPTYKAPRTAQSCTSSGAASTSKIGTRSNSKNCAACCLKSVTRSSSKFDAASSSKSSTVSATKSGAVYSSKSNTSSSKNSAEISSKSGSKNCAAIISKNVAASSSKKCDAGCLKIGAASSASIGSKKDAASSSKNTTSSSSKICSLSSASSGSTSAPKSVAASCAAVRCNTPVDDATYLERRSIRRKHSLRTAMFKKQKSTETAQVCDYYNNNSADIQISEILDQLSGYTTKYDSISQHDTSFAL